MSTSFSHSCVCDTHHVSPVDQLFQRSTNWQAMEVVEPPPFEFPEASNVIRVETPRHHWPVYLVSVPEDWEPNSWCSVPPGTQRFKKATTASEVAKVLNQTRIDASKTGYVSHWYIRTKFNSRFAIISVSLPKPWKPAGPLDMPPAFIYIDGSAEMIKHTLAKLNEALFTEDKTKRKRAYIARSINPCDLKTFALDEPETADELLKRHGLEIHQINAEQREQSVNRILQNMQ